MNSNPDELLKRIPDFDGFLKLSGEIADTAMEKAKVDAIIKEGEANVFRVCTTEEKYFVGGKPPSMSYIESTYKYSGINGELIDLRLRLSNVSAVLEQKRLVFDIYKTMIEVWRTLCSNQRSGAM
jgi:hypothetical protein